MNSSGHTDSSAVSSCSGVRRDSDEAVRLDHECSAWTKLTLLRHIYYQHQNLFESQRVVDDLVDRVAKTLDARRDDLNIVSVF